MITQIRISQAVDGTFSVLELDRNGVWVVACSKSHGFKTREEAQECADEWIAGGDIEQVADAS